LGSRMATREKSLASVGTTDSRLTWHADILTWHADIQPSVLIATAATLAFAAGSSAALVASPALLRWIGVAALVAACLRYAPVALTTLAIGALVELPLILNVGRTVPAELVILGSVTSIL